MLRCKEASTCHATKTSKRLGQADLCRLDLLRLPWGRSRALWKESGLQAPETRVLLDGDSGRPCRLKLLRVSESGEAAVTRVSLSESTPRSKVRVKKAFTAEYKSMISHLC